MRPGCWPGKRTRSYHTVSLSEYLGTECMTRIKPTFVPLESSTAGLKRWCQGGVRHSIHARKIRYVFISDLSSLSTPFTTICSCSTRQHLDFLLTLLAIPHSTFALCTRPMQQSLLPRHMGLSRFRVSLLFTKSSQYAVPCVGMPCHRGRIARKKSG